LLGNLLYEQCDKVLLDAPCSGEGMQYKSDFKIYQRNEKAVRKLAHTQYELLLSGLNALKI
jgi:16S rRNA C967 or C1407 C5-methylase (RsmB/RsmF family)